jgi:hypothetical protein
VNTAKIFGRPNLPHDLTPEFRLGAWSRVRR